MKKSVVILIAIIYVLAIALVSFFGLQFKMFEQIIPVETLEILNEGLLQSEKWGRYTVVNLVGGNGEFRIEYRVHPDDATNKTLDFKPTVVVISQRAVSVRDCDSIVVLDNGEAVGIGTHDELYAGCEVYREICDSQMGGASI